jgi:hypothetical protein
MKKNLLLINLIFLTCIANAQVTKTANVTTPGTLITVAKTYLTTVTNLTVTGTIDASDIKTMRDAMPALAVLDLSSATIAEYVGASGTSGPFEDTFKANTIPQYAFYNTWSEINKPSLTSVTLPDNITSIGDAAFYWCTGLKSLTIPPKVTSIGLYAFSLCNGLTGSLTIPPLTTYIADYAFSYCSGFNGTLSLPSSITYIGNEAFFNDTNFTGTITIPSLVTYIGDSAFFDCSRLTGSLTLPATASYIGDMAFGNCTGFTAFNVVAGNPYYSSLNGVLFNKNKTTLNAYPGGLKGTYSIPVSVDSIRNGAFEGCTGLKGSLSFPPSVSYIGISAYNGCSGLTDSLIIPSTVNYIGYRAFAFCPGLTSLVTLNPIPLPGDPSEGDPFYADLALNNIIVPCGSVNVYYGAWFWCYLWNRNLVANDRFVPVYASADTVKPGTTVTFTANNSCFNEAVKFQWKVNGKNNGTDSSSFSYTPLNGDTVTCNASYGDSTLISNAIVMTVIYNAGINLAGTESFTVYPNPATDHIIIEYPGFNNSDNNLISIYNIQGESILNKQLQQEKTEINIENLPQGVYIIKFTNGVNFNITRFVKN